MGKVTKNLSILKSLPMPTYVFNHEGLCIDTYGSANDTSIGRSIYDTFEENHASNILDEIRNAITTRIQKKVSFSIDNNENQLEWYEGYISPVLEDDMGCNSVLFTHFPVTEFKNKVLELTLEKESLKRLAMKDDVTGLYNRRCFYSHVANSFSNFMGNSLKSLSILLVDIDNFKGINDGYGHLVGDSVIIDLSNRILKTCKGKGYFARFGGDEFIVALENHSLSEACKFAEYLRKSIENSHDNDIPHYTVCIGVSEVQSLDEELEESIDRADEMLYYAKNSGKNKVLYSIL